MPLTLDQQDFALHWTNVIRKSNAEMAFQFVSRVPLALKLIGLEGSRQWLLHAMDIYDKEGLYPGSAAFENIEQFAREYRLSHITVTLEQVQGILETIICGLTGRELKIESGNSTYTDTETLYLPAAINRFNDRDKNYQLYKVTAVHLWAQTWFGTFRRPAPDSPHLSEIIGSFPDQGRALRLFNHLETIRLNACIHRELPGLGREILTMHTWNPIQDATWKTIIDILESPEATVADTIEATSKLYQIQIPWPEDFPYQGGFNLGATEFTIEQRIEQDKLQLQTSLNDLLDSQPGDADHVEKLDPENAEIELTTDDSGSPYMTLDGEALSLPADLSTLLSSMLQDLISLPEDWLVPTSDGEHATPEQDQNRDQGTISGHHKNGALMYDEWDYRRQTYRKSWCVLRELTTHPVYDDFPANTLERHAHLVGEIRKHFEALRGEDKILKAQSTGDDIDLDALITARADMLTGVEMTDRLYTHMRKQERDLAVIFMVDVSGSTKGWINDAERESLILLCQALEILGDQYAIYGFSGMTRNRCEVYKIKTFEQDYDRDVRARISGLRPQDYTRMGVTIRHLTRILNKVEAKTRILITLSDGKPDDYDGYRGDYGIEDTRQALLEARHTGIHPFCITIDTEASDYLPHMYGHASFVVVDEVRKLPLKVADIYRRLTT
jgi:nitric oxide reductase NorD protein